MIILLTIPVVLIMIGISNSKQTKLDEDDNRELHVIHHK